MNQITVLDAMAQWLKSFGSQVVFGLPSDDLEFMKSIEDNKIEYIVAKDQRNAMFMATGYAMASKKLGICNIGKGPAATNCMTGILEAKSQNASVIVIASGTDTQRYGSDKAFQEIDQIKLISPLVKWSHRLENEESIEWVIKKAVFFATNGSPGPVYLEIPENIGRKLIEMQTIDFQSLNTSRTLPDPENLEKAIKLIQQAKRPVILVGGGCKRISNKTLLTDFADQLEAPIFVTASGRGSINEDHPLFSGLAGLYCPDVMNTLIDECDLFISLGSKLEETAIFGWDEKLRDINVIEINLNEEHFNLNFSSLKLVGDIQLTLKPLIHQFSISPLLKRRKDRIHRLKKQLFEKKEDYLMQSEHLKVADILKVIQSKDAKKRIYVHENGLQDMWSYYYPYLSINYYQDAIVPSEQTSLGFGCAAAIGVKKACPDSLVLAFVGDGAFNLFSAELSTLIEYQIPIIYIVLKNGGYGWLEYQNKNNQSNTPFINKKIPLVSIQHPQLKILTLEGKTELEDVWSEALDLHLKGKTVVIEATVSIEDVPTSLLNIYGDFPEKELVK